MYEIVIAIVLWFILMAGIIKAVAIPFVLAGTTGLFVAFILANRTVRRLRRANTTLLAELYQADKDLLASREQYASLDQGMFEAQESFEQEYLSWIEIEEAYAYGLAEASNDAAEYEEEVLALRAWKQEFLPVVEHHKRFCLPVVEHINNGIQSS